MLMIRSANFVGEHHLRGWLLVIGGPLVDRRNSNHTNGTATFVVPSGVCQLFVHELARTRRGLHGVWKTRAARGK